MQDKDYKKIAEEFEKEIHNLWNDIETAFDGKVDARKILTSALVSSEKAVKEIKNFS